DEAVAGAGDEAGDDATAAGTQDQAAPPDPAGVAGRVPGRVVELAAAPGASRVITVALDRAETTRVRVHHLIGGRPASVTEMVVALTGTARGAEPVASAGDRPERRQGGGAGSGDVPAEGPPDGPVRTFSIPSAPEPSLPRLGDAVDSVGE